MAKFNKTDHDITSRVKVKQLLLSETVHARSNELDVDFADMIGINIGGRQSPSMLDIDLLSDISLGSINLYVRGRYYELSLKKIRIVLEKENASVQPGTYYKMTLQSGNFEETISEKEVFRRIKNTEIAGSGENSIKIANILPLWKAVISGKISSKIESGDNVEVTLMNKAINVRELVYHSGQETWLAGGPGGDPRRSTKDLRGEVIGGDGDKPTPLCGLEAINPNESVSGRLRIRTEIDGFVLANSQDHEIALENLFKSVKDEQVLLLQRRVKAERELKKKVAALSMVKDNRKAKNSEIDLAVRSFVFEPDV